MSPEAERPDEIYFAALERDSPEARAAYLDEVCGADTELRRRVERLLDAQPHVGSFLDAPAVGPTLTFGTPPVLEAPGTVIGPYKLLEAIGEGGMGVVYMAEQTDPVRRKVALKIIKPGMDTRQVIARFEAEQQALALMDHPNIARVLDAGATESGRPYFVMELVRGIPITDYCDKTKLSIRDRLGLFVAVCQAVQHAHQKGIIHRDLKPSNILITLHDGVPVPKVIEFGVAKATGQQLTEKTLFTGFAQLVGTPLYMSPEQAELSGLDVDTRSDIYSLGVLLYELLTGTTPFDAETLRKAAFDEVRRIIREEEPPNPSTRLSSLGTTLTDVSAKRGSDPRRLNKVVCGELDWIVMQALEKDRNRRYETANALAADVRNYLDDEPVQACPPSAWYRLSKAARRNRAALMTAALVLSALVVGLSLSIWQAIRATRAERAALRAEATIRRERDRAVKAEGQATEAARQAQTEAAISKAINDFLRNDLLAEAAPEKNARNQQVTVEAVLNKAAARIAGKFADQPEVEAAIRHTIGATYRALGLPSEALSHLERTLELRRRVLGPEHSDTLKTMNQVGEGYLDQRQLKKAEQLFQQLLEVRHRVLGPEHPDTLEALRNLAGVDHYRRDYDKAGPMLTRALESARRVLGPEHPFTLMVMEDMAYVYEFKGEPEKAAAQRTEVLEVRRRVLGPGHLSTLEAMTDLAGLYLRQGQVAKAEPVLLEALESQRRLLGGEHPWTVESTAYIVQMICNVKNIKSEKRLQAVELGRWVVKQDPNNQLRWKWLAAAEYCAGNWDEAIRAAEKCIELRGDKGWAFLFLVLASSHARRGDMDGARAWSVKLQDRIRSGGRWADTPPWLIAEGEALLGLTNLPDDVFAPP